LNGTLTLDGQNNPNAVWVFKIGSTLITGSAASVVLINGAQSCNVFWQVGSSATLGTGTNFVGNILALTSITLTTDAIVSGRALAQNGAVTLDSNQVAVSTCSVAVSPIPPTVGKAFNPVTVDTGVASTLTITLTNADPTNDATAAGFTDTLPSGLVAVAGSAATTCGGTASNTTSSVTLAGGTIPAAGSCAVTVEVIAANAGSYINSLAAGALSTSNGSNVAPAVATLTVNTPVTAAIPPTVSKAFNQATINAGGASILSITLSNADSADASGATLTDTLPNGVVVANPPSATNSCGGTFAPSAGDAAVTLTGGTIPASSFCVLTLEVTAANAGNYFNAIPAGALVTINGSNAAPAIATLTVITPTTGAVAPTLSKAFNLATITAGGTSTLTITLSNAGTVDDAVTGLTDTLPSGLVAVSGSAGTTCVGGTASNTGSSVTLTGGTIPAGGSCEVTAEVTAAVGGSYINTLAAGALITDNGSNAAPAIATLTVNAAVILPTVAKAFSPATIPAGGSSTLTITLTNSNTTAATLTASFTDTLPIDLVVSSATTTCGGTVSNTASTVTLPTGDSIPAAGSCVITADMLRKYRERFSMNVFGALSSGNWTLFETAPESC
jgi:uncharacterized repeat protein (TIGR01451 family)